MKEKKARKLKPVELVIYIISGLFILWGLTYITLGLVAKYLPVTNSPLKIANATIARLFGLDMFGWGLVIFILFALVAAITMIVFAKNVDKEYEKSQRRAARLSRANKTETAPEASKIVDAEVK